MSQELIFLKKELYKLYQNLLMYKKSETYNDFFLC